MKETIENLTNEEIKLIKDELEIKYIKNKHIKNFNNLYDEIYKFLLFKEFKSTLFPIFIFLVFIPILSFNSSVIVGIIVIYNLYEISISNNLDKENLYNKIYIIKNKIERKRKYSMIK